MKNSILGKLELKGFQPARVGVSCVPLATTRDPRTAYRGANSSQHDPVSADLILIDAALARDRFPACKRLAIVSV